MTKRAIPKSKSVENLADELFKTMQGGLDGHSGAEREMTEGMMKTFCWLSASCTLLQQKISDDGWLVEQEKGAANNKHIEMVENPSCKTLNKLMAQKANYYAKLSKQMGDSDGDDELMDFLRD